MGRGAALIVGVLLVLIGQPCAAATARPITKPESRRIPPEAVKRRVLEQLGDALIMDPLPKPGGRLKRPLTDMFFDTVPHATELKGLCRSDAVRIDFDPAGAAAESADTPVKATGIKAYARYRFLAPPAAADPGYLRWENRDATDHQCARLDPLEQRFIAAPTADAAAEGAYLFLKVLDGLRSASPAFELDCSRSSDCHRFLTDSVGLDAIDSIDRCEDEKTGRSCLSIDAASIDHGFRIYFTSGDPPVISRVEIVDIITVADARAD